jgi:hypothetical protein
MKLQMLRRRRAGDSGFESDARLRLHLGSKPQTAAKSETMDYAQAFRRAFDLQQRCRLR